jgi:uncharacterized protein (DUF4415 family)
MSAKRIKRPTPDSMRKPSRGRANFERLRNMSEEEIERTSPPELKGLGPDFWKDAILMYPDGKSPISLRLDADIVHFFRGGGPGYQTRMNAVLRSYVDAMKVQKKPKKAPPRGK